MNIIDHPAQLNRTALHLAAARSSTGVLRCLLLAGAVVQVTVVVRWGSRWAAVGGSGGGGSGGGIDLDLRGVLGPALAGRCLCLFLKN
jgi:hypothetical protein